MRRNVIFLVSTLIIVFVALTATLASGNTPVLGLDLRGGVSVVLSPVGNYKADALDVAVDVIRNRVDSLGVAEPEISRQGSDIVVDLPGVKDRCKAERIVGQTAELRFRPVLIAGVPPEKTPSTTTTTGAPGATTTTAPGATTTTTTARRRRPRARPEHRGQQRVRNHRPEHSEDVQGAAAGAAIVPTGGRRTAEDSDHVPRRRQAQGVRGAARQAGRPQSLALLPRTRRAHRRSSRQRKGRVHLEPGLDGEDEPHRLRKQQVGPTRPGAVPQAGRDHARQHRAVGTSDPAE